MIHWAVRCSAAVTILVMGNVMLGMEIVVAEASMDQQVSGQAAPTKSKLPKDLPAHVKPLPSPTPHWRTTDITRNPWFRPPGITRNPWFRPPGITRNPWSRPPGITRNPWWRR